MLLSASDELVGLPFLSAKELLALSSAKLTQVQSLLDFLPKRYEDRRRFDHERRDQIRCA